MIKVNDEFIEPLVEKIKFLPRLRTNYNFHKESDDLLQRMLNVMSKNTYIQPHKHENPDKREVFIIVQGTVAVVEFNSAGKIIDSVILNSGKENYVAEIPAKTWHTIICIDETSVVYELKDGPYNPYDDKQFANWAPKEGDIDCKTYNESIIEQII